MNGLTTAATGRVVNVAELRYARSGKAMLSFTVLVDQQFTATETRPAPEPIWLRCTAWDTRAVELSDVLKKGTGVYVEGRLTHGTWQTAEGEARCGLNLSAWTVEPHGAIGKSAPKRERNAEPAGARGVW